MPTGGHVSLTDRVTNFDFEAARGASGLSVVTLPGYNADIDTGTDPEDVWDTGGVYVAPTVARIHAIVSSSTDDDVAGDGALTVDIIGLTTGNITTTETVILTGTDAVNTVGAYTFIQSMVVASTGDDGFNVGAIIATAATDSTVSCTILATINRSRQALYVCPAGVVAYVTRIDTEVLAGTAAATADFEVLTQGTFNASPFIPEMLNRVTVGVGLQTEYHPYKKLTAGQFIKVRVTLVSADETVVSARLTIVEDAI
jgi:hypothetical protein